MGFDGADRNECSMALQQSDPLGEHSFGRAQGRHAEVPKIDRFLVSKSL
jgi:hypothetical protein